MERLSAGLRYYPGSHIYNITSNDNVFYWEIKALNEKLLDRVSNLDAEQKYIHEKLDKLIAKTALINQKVEGVKLKQDIVEAIQKERGAFLKMIRRDWWKVIAVSIPVLLFFGDIMDYIRDHAVSFNLY